MFKNLEGEMVRRGITPQQIADKLKISVRAFKNKLKGLTEFTWKEVCVIHSEFFPDISKEELFKRTMAI